MANGLLRFGATGLLKDRLKKKGVLSSVNPLGRAVSKFGGVYQGTNLRSARDVVDVGSSRNVPAALGRTVARGLSRATGAFEGRPIEESTAGRAVSGVKSFLTGGAPVPAATSREPLTDIETPVADAPPQLGRGQVRATVGGRTLEGTPQEVIDKIRGPEEQPFDLARSAAVGGDPAQALGEQAARRFGLRAAANEGDLNPATGKPYTAAEAYDEQVANLERRIHLTNTSADKRELQADLRALRSDRRAAARDVRQDKRAEQDLELARAKSGKVEAAAQTAQAKIFSSIVAGAKNDITGEIDLQKVDELLRKSKTSKQDRQQMGQAFQALALSRQNPTDELLRARTLEFLVKTVGEDVAEELLSS